MPEQGHKDSPWGIATSSQILHAPPMKTYTVIYWPIGAYFSPDGSWVSF